MKVFALFVLLCIINQTQAAEFWFYKWRDSTQLSSPDLFKSRGTSADKNGLVITFHQDPYTGQLNTLRDLSSYQAVTLIFERPPAAALAQEYSELAQAWASAKIEGQFTFVGSLPTELEAQILSTACSARIRLVFITRVLPTSYESENLRKLGSCVNVKFALGRYFRDQDLADLRALADLPLSLVNNYLPAYTHVDALNRLKNPVTLDVTQTLPDAEQVDLLQQIRTLTRVLFEPGLFPDDKQYAVLKDFRNRRQLGFRWTQGRPRESDLKMLSELGLGLVLVPQETLEDPSAEKILRSLNGKVVFESMQTRTLTIDGWLPQL